jgi:hypothetical protein
MADCVSAEDLKMYHAAHQQAVAAERAVQQFAQAQQQHVAAVGALQFVARTISERYGLTQGGSFNPETGEIVRPGASAAADAEPTKTWPPPLDTHVAAPGRRKK